MDEALKCTIEELVNALDLSIQKSHIFILTLSTHHYFLAIHIVSLSYLLTIQTYTYLYKIT